MKSTIQLLVNAGLKRTAVTGKSVQARCRLASASGTSVDTLELLANDGDEFVRSVVASRSSLPAHIRQILLKDPSVQVREVVHNCNPDGEIPPPEFAVAFAA